jgi:uncharacterized protein YifN (PemK superfamily)
MAHVHIFSQNPNPVGAAQGFVAHAICDHLYTVHANRLRPVLNLKGRPMFGRIEREDLTAIMEKVRNVLAFKTNAAPASTAS